MINKSSDEYATRFELNKSRSCWELDKENKAIEIRDIEKPPANFTDPPSEVSQTQMSWAIPEMQNMLVVGYTDPVSGAHSIKTPSFPL